MARHRAISAIRRVAALAPVLALAGCGGNTNGVAPGVVTGVNMVVYATDRLQTPGAYDLRLYDLDQSGFRAIAGLNSTDVDREPALSPDGRFVAFASDRPSSTGGWNLFVYDRFANNNAGALIATPGLNTNANEREPVFTGNSQGLAFTLDSLSRKHVRVYDALTDSRVTLNGLQGPDSTNDWSPAPDQLATRIAFISDRGGRAQIHVWSRDSARVWRLPNLTAADGVDEAPSLTADGRFLAFSSTRSGGAGGFDLYLYDLTTKAYLTLPATVNTAADERAPSLGANTDMLAFQSNRAGGLGKIDIYQLVRSTGAVTQGAGESSADDDIEPSLRWP